MLANKRKISKGFSLLEIVVAVAIFALVSTGVVGVVIQGLSLNRLSNERVIANQFASEGLEAVRSIKNQSFPSLTNTNSSGVSRSSGTWSFSGADNYFDKYTRTISIYSVQRDSSGNIVESGGTDDPLTKKAVSRVTWSFSESKQQSIELSTYLSNWRGEIPSSQKGGIIVYGDGGTTSDAIKYRLLDSNTWNWSTPLAVADIDSSSTNRALRSAKLYSSTNRIEKILVSRHFDGSNQYIYGQVYNGIDWGNVVLLSQWRTSSFMDVQNFDGTYLENGDFMVSYSDNTNTPKYRIWNSTNWSNENSLLQIGYAPTYLILKNRPGTNEAMVAIYDQGKNVTTQYFDGKAYAINNWNSLTSHPTKANDNSQRLIDFDWSHNSSIKGGLIYVSSNNVKALSIKIWTADGLGSGSWGVAADTTPQSSNLGVLQVAGIPGLDGFLACEKDNSGTPQVICYRSDFTPTWSYPTNNTISLETDHVIEQSFDIGIEQKSRSTALGVFSDKTGISFPSKYKTYNLATNSWDVSPTTVNTAPYTTGNIKIVRIIPKSDTDDMMVLVGDSNLSLYSFVWNGTDNNFYSSPAGRAFTRQSVNGADSAETWYDFAWD